MKLTVEERMQAVRELLQHAHRVSGGNLQLADALVASAANVLAGVVHQQNKVIDIQAYKRL